MGGHSKVHAIGNDCEMHITGTPREDLGTPGAVIAEADQLLADAATGAGKSRVLVHGMITYDYFNIVRAVRDRDRNWRSDRELEAWTPVEFPVSLVLFGASPEATESDELDGDD